MIYANNAGTSWPKAPGVHEAVLGTLEADPDTWGVIFERAHSEVALCLGVRHHPERLMITSGCTAALATLLTTLPWSQGDRLVTSALEHHALARWATALGLERGVEHAASPYAPGHPMDLEWVERTLKQGRVRLIACTMASNVTGEVLPVAELGQLAHAHGALLLVDAAQTAGTVPLDCEALGVDMLTFAGHKGPLGPQGVGGFYAAPHVTFRTPSASCDVHAVPGQGTVSEAACSLFPSWCDVGSVNLAGLAGLAAGFRWLREQGSESRGHHVRSLTEQLWCGLEQLPGVALLGGPDSHKRTAVVSLQAEQRTPGELQKGLAVQGIQVRAGFHCAPWAHDVLGTASQGTLRISLGVFNTSDDVDTIVAGLNRLL